MKLQGKLSPDNYIITKGRDLPFYECRISKNWQKDGMASLFITKIMPSGKYIVGMYMIDILCLGIKDSAYKFALTQDEYNTLTEKIAPSITMSVADAHNVIYGSLDYAEELGFKPIRAFSITECLLNPDLIDDGIDTLEFESDGMPLYIRGIYDDSKKIFATLDKNVGKENYHFIEMVQQFE